LRIKTARRAVKKKIDNAWECLQRAIKEFARATAIIFDEIVELAESIRDVQANQEERKKYRRTWHVPKDTRVKSQVMNNKPKYIVRKVIR